MKIGAYLMPGRDLAAARDLATRAEALGYESVWVTHGVARDSFLVLAAYGAVTRRVRLGNGVVPIYPRHPTAMAQAALTMSELTAGRFVLGIGVSHRATMEAMLGLPLDDPLGIMREYVGVLRGAFTAAVKHEGRHFKVDWAFRVPQLPPAPPIHLAALSTRMLELAGEIADGAILWLCPPAYIREVAVAALTRGRARAGKPLEGFEIVAAVPLAVTGDRQAATAAFRTELGHYLRLPFYRNMLIAAGLGEGVAAFDRTGEAPAALTDALGAVGPADVGRDYVRRYREAGATVPAIRPITSPEAPWYRATLEAAAGW